MKEVSHKRPHTVYFIYLKCMDYTNLKRYNVDYWLQEAAEGESWRKTASVYRLPYRHLKNILKLDYDDSVQLCEYTKNNELYISNG